MIDLRKTPIGRRGFGWSGKSRGNLNRAHLCGFSPLCERNNVNDWTKIRTPGLKTSEPPDLPWTARFVKQAHRYWWAGVLVCVGITAALLAWRAVTPPLPDDDVLLWGADASGGAPYVWEEHGKLKGF